MARKTEVLPPTTPLLCDHIAYQNKRYADQALVLRHWQFVLKYFRY